MGPFKKSDVESAPGETAEKYPDIAIGFSDEGAVHKSEFVAGNTWYAKLNRVAGRFGVEQRGIERVPSDERTDTGMSKIGTLVSLLKLAAYDNVSTP
jgi:hypothetical protein